MQSLRMKWSAKNFRRSLTHFVWVCDEKSVKESDLSSQGLYRGLFICKCLQVLDA
jgi:hypothetical protein